MAHRRSWYPITIREARYNGTYSGGRWVLIAGVHKAEQRTAAFGSDIPCMEFWQRVKDEGPILEMEDYRRPDGGTREYYVASGDDPSELLEEFTEYVDELDDD